MISYFILNKSGNLLYQSINGGKLDNTDNGRIRYLPLLLIKDLIKANLNNHIQHAYSAGKLVVFYERHNLLFIANTKQDRIPITVLHKHLVIMDNFLRFTFGPQWQLRLHNDISSHSRRLALHPTLTTHQLSTCLAHLPFIGSSYTLRSHRCLCLTEQVDLQEELNTRLTETLRDCCNNSFPHLTHATVKTSGNKFSTFFANPRRRTSSPPPHFYSHQQNGQDNGQSSPETNHLPSNWNHALLFAREKIVVHCSNKDQLSGSPITDDLLYYLKLLVADYLCKHFDYGATTQQEPHLKEQQNASIPQTIAGSTTTNISSSSITNTNSISPSTSSPTLCTSSSTNDSTNQISPSPFSYIHDTNTTPAFKIYTKATTTQVSSSTTTIPIVSWSNPPPLIHSHLLSRLPKNLDHDETLKVPGTTTSTLTEDVTLDMEDDLLNEMTAALKVSSLTASLDHHYQHHGDNDNPILLPPNAKTHHHQHQLHPRSSSPTSISTSLASTSCKDTSYLSSSVPSIAATNISTLIINNSNNHIRHYSEDGSTNNDLPVRRRGSTNSSPLAGRSRRQSLVDRHHHHHRHRHHHILAKYISQSDQSDEGSQDGQQKQHHPQNQSQRQKHQRGAIKTVRRWLRHGNRIMLTRIHLVQVSEGLVVVLLFTDEMFSTSTLPSSKSVKYQQRQQHQLKQFTISLQNGLHDFSSFLLTKESVHFSILSFALTYPGLVHFIHIKNGIITSPQLVDLNEMDKHHEILHEVYGTYNIKPATSISTVIGKWRWPTVTQLKKMCDSMLYHGFSSRHAPPKIHSLQAPTRQRQGYHYMYLSGHHHRHHHQQQQQQHQNPTQGQQKHSFSMDQDHDEELLAMYFSFVPVDSIYAMHQQLLSDISQRHFFK
ncbi:hypothetical protein BCR42DRAFT_497374 [Absidia repens]|uniref:Uncharacterized protein n=1 Tax=Absidia repens TaxID=90262 RepID=A0A1X2HIK0_9FUNG|nr:hypothetical protein BCR42DRAFT_497374 [Absidia repens]